MNPDVDSICVNFSLNLTYNPNPDPWGGGSRWQLSGGGSASPNSTSQTIDATWGNAGSKTIRARVRNGPGPATVVTQSPVAGTLIGEGVTTVTLTVTDAGSNTANCTADITVTDITDPVISGCPANINTDADTSCCPVLRSAWNCLINQFTPL